MSTVIPVAKQSPRINEDGTIAWYQGDAFSIDWTINLTEDEQPVEYQEGDVLVWSFFNKEDTERPVHTFTFVYGQPSWMSGSTVTLNFSKEISDKFDIGSYTYCVKFLSHDDRVVTLNASNKVKIEKCH